MVASRLLTMLAILPVIYLRTLSKHTETCKESDRAVFLLREATVNNQLRNKNHTELKEAL